MKKLLIFSLVVMNIAASSCGNDKKTTAVAVPEAVMTSFNAKYPGVTDVKWDQENDKGKILYDGEFKMDGKKKEARFDDTGNFIDEK